jgi:hypothetical protein
MSTASASSPTIGEPFTMAFVSSFRLYERFLRGEDITPILQETKDVGANGVRVFGAFDFGSPDVQRLYPSEHPDYYDRLGPFFALLASFGLYAQFTVFADTQRTVPSLGYQRDHWGFVCAALQGVPNVLLERVNEADAHENRVDADVRKPDGICASFGSNGAGNNPPAPFWDYADLHSVNGPAISRSWCSRPRRSPSRFTASPGSAERSGRQWLRNRSALRTVRLRGNGSRIPRWRICSGSAVGGAREARRIPIAACSRCGCHPSSGRVSKRFSAASTVGKQGDEQWAV